MTRELKKLDINYKDTEEYKEYLKKINKDKCKECGGTNHILERHKETCSQFKHYVDDHYDSACMRGRCKHCNPEYKEKHYVMLDDEEYNLIKEYRKNKKA